MIDNDSVMLVTNYSPQPFRFTYGGRDYMVRAGSRGVLVPWAAVKLYLGDPFLQDRIDDRGVEDRFRTAEIDRINFRYGMLDRPFYSDDPAAKTGEYADGRHILPESAQPRPYVRTDSVDGYIPAPGAGVYRHPNLPWLHVYEMDGGENRRVYMIVDDPQGIAESFSTEAENQASVDATAREMDDLRRRLIELERAQQINLSSTPVEQPTALPVPAPRPVAESVAVDPIEATPFIGGDDLTAAAGLDPLADVPGDAPPPVDLAEVDPLDNDLAAAFASASAPPATPSVPATPAPARASRARKGGA